MELLHSMFLYTKGKHVALKCQQIEIFFVRQQIYPRRIKKCHEIPGCPGAYGPSTHSPKHTTAHHFPEFGNLLQTRTHDNQTPPSTLILELFDSPTHSQKLRATVRKQTNRTIRQSDPRRTTARRRLVRHDDVTLRYIHVTSGKQNLDLRYSTGSTQTLRGIVGQD
jgi:hypothetical protein